MIQLLSTLNVADNTGARKARMIRKTGQITDTAGVGDVITVHIRESATDASVKKGEVAKAVVVRTKAPVRRSDGSNLRFDSNAVVIIDATNNPKGTRIFGPVARELRAKNFMKIMVRDEIIEIQRTVGEIVARARKPGRDARQEHRQLAPPANQRDQKSGVVKI